MSEPTTRVVKITPATAEEYLSRNSHNRKISDDRVNAFAEAMKRGEWQETHQGIAFDSNGAMIDGQHRCMAIIRSECTVSMPVTTGLPPAVFAIIDTGRVRSPGDVLAIEGVRDANSTASALRLIDRYVRGTPRPWNARKAAMTNVQILAASERWAHDLPPFIGQSKAIGKRIKVNRTGLTAALYIAWRWCKLYGHADYEEWFTGLKTGANLPVGDPRLALVAYLTGPMGQVPYSYRNELTLMASLRAFDLSVKSESLKILRVLDPSTYVYHLPGFEPDVLRAVFLEGE